MDIFVQLNADMPVLTSKFPATANSDGIIEDERWESLRWSGFIGSIGRIGGGEESGGCKCLENHCTITTSSEISSTLDILEHIDTAFEARHTQ